MLPGGRGTVTSLLHLGTPWAGLLVCDNGRRSLRGTTTGDVLNQKDLGIDLDEGHCLGVKDIDLDEGH